MSLESMGVDFLNSVRVLALNTQNIFYAGLTEK